MRWLAIVLIWGALGCGSLPTDSVEIFSPVKDGAFVEEPPKSQPFQVLGIVRTKVNYPSALPEYTDEQLCKNYYNKAVKQLVKAARKKYDADAVITIRSVVRYMDGKHDVFKTPECSDDGNEGQIAVQGRAIRFTKPEEEPPL